MDRAVAAVAGMAAALYVLASLVAWGRVVQPRSESMFAGVFLDRAVAWSALFVLFGLHAGVQLQWFYWHDEAVETALLLALLAIYLAGMWSVRQISQRLAPFGGPVVFAIVTCTVGLIILLA